MGGSESTQRGGGGRGGRRTDQTSSNPVCQPQTPVEPNKLVMPQLVGGTSTLLSDEEVLSFLPELVTYEKIEWERLFNSNEDGASFNRLCKHIIGKGPTLLVVKDKSGKRFGGFASVSWKKANPEFYGTPRCFLFHINDEVGEDGSPKGVEVFRSSSYNDHFMYLNSNMSELPNGLAMGGQHGWFGLHIHDVFDTGESRGRCSTFLSPSLASSEQFDIDVVEVWGLDIPPPEVIDIYGYDSEEDGGDDDDPNDPEAKLRRQRKKKSVMSSEATAADRVILGMLGRVGASDGLRDPEPD